MLRQHRYERLEAAVSKLLAKFIAILFSIDLYAINAMDALAYIVGTENSASLMDNVFLISPIWRREGVIFTFAKLVRKCKMPARGKTCLSIQDRN